MKVISREGTMLQLSVFSCKIDLHFPRHRLAIEVDKKGHKDRNKSKKVKREKTIKKHLDFKFFRINPDEKYIEMYLEIGKIYNHIIRSSEKSSKIQDFK